MSRQRKVDPLLVPKISETVERTMARLKERPTAKLDAVGVLFLFAARALKLWEAGREAEAQQAEAEYFALKKAVVKRWPELVDEWKRSRQEIASSRT